MLLALLDLDLSSLAYSFTARNHIPAQLLVCPAERRARRDVIFDQAAVLPRLLVDLIDGLEVVIIKFHELDMISHVQT